MALTSCRECGQQVSDRATSCPACGAPRAATRTHPHTWIAFAFVMALVAVVVLALAACGESPTALGDAEPMEPFAWFADRYREMEDCSNVDGDPLRVRWFSVLNSATDATGAPTYERPSRFTAEWKRPHDVYIGTNEHDGETLVQWWLVDEGAIKDILQTNDVPQWARDTCNLPPVEEL